MGQTLRGQGFWWCVEHVEVADQECSVLPVEHREELGISEKQGNLEKSFL